MPWETLKEVAEYNRDARAQDNAQPPDSCPIDGTPLEENSQGVRNCPMGNFTWRGGPAQPVSQ